MPFYLTHQPTDVERQMHQNGYPWTTKTTLQPQGQGNGQHPDHLNPHSHHSQNAHVITSGTLSFQTIDPQTGNPSSNIQTLVAKTRNPASKQITMQPGQQYMSRSVTQECTFIEGHRRMSGNTLLRSETRNDVVHLGDCREQCLQKEATRHDNNAAFTPAVNGPTYWLRPRL